MQYWWYWVVIAICAIASAFFSAADMVYSLVDQNKLKKDIEKLERKLSFVVIQIGDNNISDIYIRSKEKVANELEILFNYIKIINILKQKYHVQNVEN